MTKERLIGPESYGSAVESSRAIVSAIAARLGEQDHYSNVLSDRERAAYNAALDFLRNQIERTDIK